MANYADLPDFFPTSRQVQSWFSKSNRLALEHQVHELAFHGYCKEGTPDKELQRFIKPCISWNKVVPVVQQPSSFFKWLGVRSWFATLQDAPFIPAQCLALLKDFFSGPRSVGHLVGTTHSRMRIMYIADDLGSVQLKYDSVDSHAVSCMTDLVIIIVEKDISVSVADLITLNKGLYSRSIIGSVGERSRVTVLTDHNFTSNSLSMYHDRWTLDQGAQLMCREVLTGGQQTWMHKEFRLANQGHVDYRFIAALQGDEQVALTTIQDHVGVSSSSTVAVKVALSDRARSFYRGTIAIQHCAEKSEADQQQRALMLSAAAKTCAIPSLEVATNDVSCQHGSAAGQFSMHELWYLRSRGLDTEKAQCLLIEGFFNESFLHDKDYLISRLKDHTRLQTLVEL